MENTPEPELTDLPTVQRRSAYQSIQPVLRPPWWGVDLDFSRRPGMPMMKAEPAPFPNTRFPPERQRATSAVLMHGRPNKTMPPVFGTAVPLKGLSGLIRRLAYRLPDHRPAHWGLKLLGDRVDSWEYHLWKYAPVAAPLGLLLVLRRLRG